MARNYKIRCREIAAYALKVGWLRKPELCGYCRKPRRLQMHHADYSKPLEVTWLCTNCHAIVEGAKRRRLNTGHFG